MWWDGRHLTFFLFLLLQQSSEGTETSGWLKSVWKVSESHLKIYKTAHCWEIYTSLTYNFSFAYYLAQLKKK